MLDAGYSVLLITVVPSFGANVPDLEPRRDVRMIRAPDVSVLGYAERKIQATVGVVIHP
jgi:hypothetical protein